LADLFADTYAFFALVDGNPRYVRVFRHKRVSTSALNVLELYATLLRRIDPAEAREIASGVLSCVVPIPSELALPAGEFRNRMRSERRDCSYIDAWGYAAARHLDLPFLTGDPSFRGIDDVEFLR
jgi:predicted nucleic acid-binding protein